MTSVNATHRSLTAAVSTAARLVRKGSMALLLLGCCSPAFAASEGQPAPAMQAKLLDGTTFNLADDNGKVVIVNMWATWCAPCREEMPALDAYYRKHHDQGLVLIAPAVDFTEALIFAKMSHAARDDLLQKGMWLRASAYSPEPYPVTKALIEEGRNHLLLGGAIRAHCPVHILQGLRDEDVPWTPAMALAEHLAADPVSLTLVKDGDHRLSREADLARLSAAVEGMG